jgi:hypothetical protein
VLPLLCTTALWYESTLLEHLWKRWLLAERVCVSKNKLQPVLQPVWQQPAAACEEADVSRPHAHHLGTRHKKPPPSQRMLEKAEAQQAVAAALAPALALCPPALAPPDVAGGEAVNRGGEAVNRAPPSLDAPRAEALNKSVVGALNREGVVEALNRGYVGALALKEILKKILEYVDFVRAPAAAGVAVAHDTVRRIRAACAWLEGLLPELLPAVDALLAKPPHTNLPHRYSIYLLCLYACTNTDAARWRTASCRCASALSPLTCSCTSTAASRRPLPCGSARRWSSSHTGSRLSMPQRMLLRRLRMHLRRLRRLRMLLIRRGMLLLLRHATPLAL